jgi:ureidoacrylate peracid hydrolase
MAKLHKIVLSPEMEARIRDRRGGKLHSMQSLDPAKTALIVIDMQNVWVKEGMLAYSPYIPGIVPNINRLAKATRESGGSVWWIRAIYRDDAPRTWSAYMQFRSPEFVQAMLEELSDGSEGGKLWHGLDVQSMDRIIEKRRFSAFIQGSSELHDRLLLDGIDTVIITGTATNVCCESSARDAFMLNYRVAFISDANATASDEAHNAALNGLMVQFADIFSTDEIISLMTPAAGAKKAVSAVSE